MEKRTLGRTGLAITRLAFGGMDFGRAEEAQAEKLLNEVLDSGITYVDTAPEYPRSEELIGKYISHRRSEYFLASKCGDNMTGIGPKYLFDRKTVLSNLDNSLRLMKTDYIDVMQLHGVVESYFPDGEDCEAMRALLEAKQAGKIRFIGATVRNGRGSEPKHPAIFGYENLPIFSEWKNIDVMQVVYGGLTRTSENVISAASAKGVGVVVRGVVKQYRPYYETLFKFAKLDELLEPDENMRGFLIRYALSHPDIVSLVIGTGSSEHLADNVRTAERGKLDGRVYAEAKKRLDAAGIVAGEAGY